jgi:hypothetical protein
MKKVRSSVTLLLCFVYVFSLFTFTSCDKKAKTDNKQTITDKRKDDKTDNSNELGSLVFSNNKQKTTDVPYKPLEVKPNAAQYSVKSDLSNVLNYSQFGKFSSEQKQLQKNGFVVSPTKEEQLFYIYEKNQYLKIPSFITTDSVLHVYHIFYDYSLRSIENDKLIGFTKELTKNMLAKSIFLYNNIKNTEVKNAALKNAEYFLVAQMLIGGDVPDNVPKDVQQTANNELQLIENHSGFSKSEIFPYDLDYSQFIPRGHYTRNDDFKKYFKTMMWYGNVPFPLYLKDKQRNVEGTLQALLITYLMFLEKDGMQDLELWENIYEPTVFYAGKSDDLTIYDYKKLLLNVYGENIDIEELNNRDKINKLYKEAEKFPEPKIQAAYTSVDTPVGKQFRLIGQRYIPDSEIIQGVVEPAIRPIPKGLDVMAVLGSDRAYNIEINRFKENEKWGKYETQIKMLKKEFGKISEDDWKQNMYYGWLWTLKTLINPYEKGYPSFMTNEAWQDKSLNTSLGSWAELRHDSILYGKQVGAECGGGEEMPHVKGYVEPSYETYNRLLWLTKYSKQNLKDRKLLSSSIESKMDSFEQLLNFLIKCSLKELRNEELSVEEYDQINVYGGLLEYLTSSLVDDGVRWDEITSDTDKNMAVIADVYTVAPNKYSPGGYIEEAVGPAYEIYVVVPIGGNLYLTRGAVFSYFEFFSEQRLTDEKWQKNIKENKGPSLPIWTDTFIRGGKNAIPIPAHPYNSGC